MKMTKCFMDAEFTGLHKETTLISLALVSEDGRYFYSEFNDYDESQIDDWIDDNVVSNLLLDSSGDDEQEPYIRSKYFEDVPLSKQWNIKMRGNSLEIVDALAEWLTQFDSVQVISDCYAFDWMLFCDLFGHAFDVPDNVNYIPIDLSTLLFANGVDPDVNRENFADGFIHTDNQSIDPSIINKHNALWDAYVIRACFDKLMAKGGYFDEF